MKTSWWLTLVLAVGVGAVFGDDPIPAEWPDAGDGFKWPAPAKDAPTFAPVLKKMAGLPERDKKAVLDAFPILDNPPHDKAPELVEIAYLDLNGDGRPELFLKIPFYGGTGGRYYAILSPGEDGNYREIGSFQGGIKFLEKDDGWYRIENLSRGGGGHYSRVLNIFSKKDGVYEVRRNEDHEVYSKTVRVRDPHPKPVGPTEKK